MKQLSMNYGRLPRDLQNIVIQFAYNMKTINLLNDLALICFINSKNLPTPRSWKRLLNDDHTRIDEFKFNWKQFFSAKLSKDSPCVVTQ